MIKYVSRFNELNMWSDIQKDSHFTLLYLAPI